MGCTYPPEEYARQLAAYTELEALSFSPEDSRESVLAKLEERAAKKRVIADVANTIIREYIETFEKAPETLAVEDAEKLEALFASLTDATTHQNLDLGVTLRLARLLKAYYDRAGDLNGYVRALQDCVSIEAKLFGNHSNDYQGSAFTEECMRLAQRMDALPPASRAAFFETLYMLCCYHEKGAQEHGTARPLELFLRVDDFLLAHVGEDDPALREAAGSLRVAYNVLLLFISYCLWENRHGRAPETDRYRSRIERCAAALRRQLDAPAYAAERPSFESLLLQTDYHLGAISIEALLDGLTDLQAKAAESENPVVQASGLAQINYHYLFSLHHFGAFAPETVTELSRRRIRETLPRILQITRMINNVNFNLYMILFIAGASYTSGFDEFSNLLLEMTVYSDKVLFIHTAMVREMSRAIFDHLLETTPELFDGVAGHDTAFIRSHPEEMKKLLDDCCMFHDIGKFFMLDVVENSMRRLSDDEFRLIRSHPGAYEDIDENWALRDERQRCIHDCALTHHLWHDGTRGYPAVSQTKNRPFADILAIADSIDAATDFLGRPYNSGKTIDELIAEFQAKAGTQYGPEAAAALSAPAVRNRLQYLITEGRKEIYYRIYAFNKL